MKRAIVSMFLACAAAGCSNAPPPDQPGFPLSVEQAYQRLVNSNMVEMRDAMQCGLLVHLHPRGIANESVTWSVSSSNREMFNFTVHLVPLDNGRVGTRIAVSADERGGEAYDGDNLYPRPAMNQPIRPAIEEQVAALLEGRPFERKRVKADWNKGCQLQRSVLQNGRKLNVKEIPVAGDPMKRTLSDSAGWASPGAGWRP